MQEAVKSGRERIKMIKKDELVKWMEENNQHDLKHRRVSNLGIQTMEHKQIPKFILNKGKQSDVL